MQKEAVYGSHGFSGRDDGDALDKLTSAALGTQKSLSDYFEVILYGKGSGEEEEKSNPLLDPYVFYYTSRL